VSFGFRGIAFLLVVVVTYGMFLLSLISLFWLKNSIGTKMESVGKVYVFVFVWILSIILYYSVNLLPNELNVFKISSYIHWVSVACFGVPGKDFILLIKGVGYATHLKVDIAIERFIDKNGFVSFDIAHGSREGAKPNSEQRLNRNEVRLEICGELYCSMRFLNRNPMPRYVLVVSNSLQLELAKVVVKILKFHFFRVSRKIHRDFLTTTKIDYNILITEYSDVVFARTIITDVDECD
jgi:hypothetical protein